MNGCFECLENSTLCGTDANGCFFSLPLPCSISPVMNRKPAVNLLIHRWVGRGVWWRAQAWAVVKAAEKTTMKLRDHADTKQVDTVA